MSNFLLLFVILIAYYSPIFATENNIEFTYEEKEYLKNKKVLNFVMASEDWQPFSFIDEDGNHNGIEIDFVNLLKSRLNIPINIKYIPWREAVKSAMEHKFDAILSANPTPERERKLLFSDIYYLSSISLFTLQNHPYIDNIKDFQGKSIAIVEGSSLEQLIKAKRADLKIVKSKNGIEGILQMLIDREVDGALDYLLPMSYSANSLKFNDKLKSVIMFYSEEFSSSRYGIRNDEPLLLSIINKVINSYTKDEKRKIKDKWEGKLNRENISDTISVSAKLSKDEEEWIKNNPTIKVANEPDWPPFDFSLNGEAVGLGIDYMNMVAKKVGLNVEYINAPWEKLMEMFKSGKIDVLHSVYKTPQREEFATFTEPFYMSYYALATRKNSQITKLSDLSGKRVALLKDYGTNERILSLIPNIKPIMVNNLYEGLRAVSFGEADGVIDSIGTMSYIMMEQTLTNLSIFKVDLEANSSGNLHFATDKNSTILRDILQKGINSISPFEHSKIRNHWILQVQPSQNRLLNLTDKEKEWLKSHKTIKFIGNSDFLPFETFDNGEYIGIINDYLKFIELYLDIKFEINRGYIIDSNKKINYATDMFADYLHNQNLNCYTLTTTYLKSPFVVIKRFDKRAEFISNLNELHYKKVVILNNSTELKKLYPNIEFIEVKTVKDAFETVASGKYEALIAPLILANYQIFMNGYNNLQISGKLDFDMSLNFAIRDDWEIFVGILNKTFEIINKEEQLNILNRWNHEHINNGEFDYSMLWKSLTFFVAIILWLIYWNIVLKIKVSEKTEELTFLLKSFNEHVIASKTDVNGNIIYVSDAFCKITGYSSDELIGNNHRIFKHKDNSSEIYKQMWQKLSNGENWQGRLKNSKKDGGYYWSYSIIQCEFDNFGKLIGYTAIMHDVTSQVALEELTNNLENIIKDRTQKISMLYDEQKALFNSASIGIILIKNRVIQEANSRFYNIFGYLYGEIVGYNTRILYENDDDFIDVSKRYKEIETGKIEIWEQKLIKKDGTTFWARVSMCAVNPNDLSKGVVATLEDITLERKAIEDIKKAKDLAEDALKTKSQFLANMSHEIRTPMNSIIAMSYLALQTNLTDEQKNYISKVETASKNLMEIINSILDFSKIEAGKMLIEESDLIIKTVIKDIEDLFILKAREKNISLIFDIDEKIPTHLLGDSIRLSQVLINLISNAIKFTDKGEVKVSIKLTSENSEFVTIYFSVKDSGIGISKEQLNKLFQLFTQADSSTTRKYGGTGLGLSISKKLIEMMGGEIFVDSEVDVGSNFYFTLKFKLPKQNFTHIEEIINYEEFAKVVSGAKILLVEDNIQNQEVAVLFLKKAYINVDIANNGLEALEKVSKNSYDGILMDCQMPIMDGYEASKKIRESLKDIPIIAMTANALAGDKEQCIAFGMNDYISKPIDILMFFKTLAKWIKPKNRVEFKSQKLDNSTIFENDFKIDGINMEIAIELMAKNETLLLNQFERFTTSQKDFETTIDKLIELNSRDDVIRLAHTLKSVSANIGAIELSKKAQILEKELKDGKSYTDLDSLIKDICKNLEILIANIKVSIEPLKKLDVDISNIDKKFLDSEFLELIKLLENLDSNALERSKELLQTLTLMGYSDEVKIINELIYKFEFDKALENLKELKSQLN